MAMTGVTLLASGVITATSTGNTATNVDGYNYGSAEIQMDLTAAAAAVGDTLDMFVQTTIDGTNWIDIAHFTQALGNGGAKRFIAKVVRDLAETMYETGSALAAGSVRHILGNQYRVRYTVAGATPSFTASVKANFV